jgi:hypothetical protein
MHNFPVRSSSTTETRHKSASMSPRRSMTTIRYSDNSGSRFSGAPRRTDSISSSNPTCVSTIWHSGWQPRISQFLKQLAVLWLANGFRATLQPIPEQPSLRA